MKKAIECITKNYFNFKGRASRKEYWQFYPLAQVLPFCLQLAISPIFVGGFLLLPVKLISYTLSLFLTIPFFAVTARRLHDTGRKAWFILIPLIPLIGTIWFLVLMCKKGHQGPNRYGDDPYVGLSA